MLDLKAAATMPRFKSQPRRSVNTFNCKAQKQLSARFAGSHADAPALTRAFAAMNCQPNSTIRMMLSPSRVGRCRFEEAAPP
jgi:hypothetical protein